MIDSQHFIEHVRQNFDFLVIDYGFQVTREETIVDSTCVEYRSDRVYVRILRTAPDFEPRFVLGRLGTTESIESTSFDWIDIGDLNCCRGWKWRCHENQPFSGRVMELGRLLRDCGNTALKGDDSTFEEMMARRAALKEQHFQEETESIVRSQAEAAWHSKDYGAAVVLYRKLTGQLSQIEKQRLLYATTKLQTRE